MTQNVALIVHQVMDAPEQWKEKGDTITNGYYKVWMDASRYGVGDASYHTTEAERAILSKAVDAWKEDSGWAPPHREQQVAPAPVPRMIDGDQRVRQAYSDFARAVRSNYKSFQVHADSAIFGSGIGTALRALDAAVIPVEGVRRDAK